MLSKAVWVTTLGYPAAIFPYDNPALFSMPLAFFCCWLFSKMDGSRRGMEEQERFEGQYLRSMTGIGAEGGSGH